MRNTMIFLSRMVLIGFICALFSLGYTTEVKARQCSIIVELLPYGGNEYGTISPAEGNYEYEEGQEIDIIATPNPGFIFEKWENSGGITDNANSASTKFTVTNDGHISAHFLVAPTITFNANGGTCTTPSAVVGTNRKLASLPTATRDGYTCTGWFTDATGGDPVTTDTEFIRRTTIYAHWATTRTVTFSVVNGKWDDDSTTNRTEPVADGGSLTQAQIPGVGNKPNGGYRVGSWSSPAPDTSTPITDNVTYTYTYAEDTYEYPINRDIQGQGTIDIRSSNQSVYSARYNTPITLMAHPDPGWSFSGWESSDVVIDNPTSTSLATFLMPQEGVMLTAVFTQNPVTNHTVTYHVVNGKWNDTNTSGNRTETVANGQHPADIPPVGSKPNAGYKAGSWDTNPSTATITGNRTFTYTYATNTSPSSSSKKSDDSDHYESSPAPAPKPVNPNAIISTSFSFKSPAVNSSFGKGVIKIGPQEQGMAAQLAFRLNTPAGWREAFSFNMTVNNKTTYDPKTGMLSFTIPTRYQKDGRKFAILGIDQDGKVKIFYDKDATADTITVNLFEFPGYAFDLIYVD